MWRDLSVNDVILTRTQSSLPAHGLPASHRIFREAGGGRRHRDPARPSIANRTNNSCRISSDKGKQRA